MGLKLLLVLLQELVEAYGAAIANGASPAQARFAAVVGAITGGLTGYISRDLAIETGAYAGQATLSALGFVANLVGQISVNGGSSLDLPSAYFSGAFAPLSAFSSAVVGGRILVGTASRFSVGESGRVAGTFVSPANRFFASVGEIATSASIQGLAEFGGNRFGEFFRIPRLDIEPGGLFGTSLMATNNFSNTSVNTASISSFGLGNFGFNSFDTFSIGSSGIQSFDFTSQVDNFDIRGGGFPSSLDFGGTNIDSTELFFNLRSAGSGGAARYFGGGGVGG